MNLLHSSFKSCTLILAITLFQSLISMGQSTNDSCTVNPTIRSLISIRSTLIGREYNQGHQVPERKELYIRDSFMEEIIHAYEILYNHDTLPGWDTVFLHFDKYKWPVTLDSIGYGPWVFLSLDTSDDYFVNYSSVNPKHVEFDSLLSNLGIKVTGPHEIYNVARTVNAEGLYDTLNSFEWVIGARAPSIIGDRGREYGFKKVVDTSYISYTYGWGDCPSGCIYERTFNYKVWPDCKIEFLGNDPYEYRNPVHYPSLIENNLHSFCGDTIKYIVNNKKFPGSFKPYNIRWSDGQRGDTINISHPGTYLAYITPMTGRRITYTAKVEVLDIRKQWSELKDTIMCEGENFMLDLSAANKHSSVFHHSKKWGDQWFPVPHLVNDTGVYIVYSKGCDFDTFSVKGFGNKVVALTDTVLCPGDSFKLSTTGAYDSLLWSDGSKDRLRVKVDTGLNSARFFIGHCKVNDSIHLEFHEIKPLNLGKDTSIFENDTLTINLSGYNTYHWFDNDQDSIRSFGPGLKLGLNRIWVTVWDDNFCKQSDTFDVQVKKNIGVEFIDQNGVSLFPNPATTVVQLNGVSDYSLLCIVNALGGQVITSNLEADVVTVDIQNLTPGIYLCRLTGAKEEMVIRLVKVRD